MDGETAALSFSATLRTSGLALGAVLSVLFLVSAVDHWRVSRRSRSRLARFAFVPAALKDAPGAGRSTRPDILRLAGAAVARRSSPATLQALRGQVVRAGLSAPLSVEEYCGVRVLSALAGLALGLAFAALIGPLGLLLAVLGGPVGYVLPSIILARMARQRRKRIERLLPDTVDVIVVSLEAGLGFDSAVAFLSERIENDVTVELRRYLADMQLGRSRAEALEAMVDRTRSEDVRELAEAIIQAEELGTGLVRAMRGQAASLREKRRARVAEQAHTAPLKLLFPIVLFLMPALFLVLIGPAMVQLLNIFGRQ